ncbi:DNA translocase FtsK, partial [Rhodoblastus sp.]|uniref:DNA translocase FtsK n=1 Tax=Rhodoblastus sp. TaxID=1962975 RepID=UPI0026159741
MLITLDQWLARFFGASRRADRAAPLAQRASFGLDGVEMRQIEDEFTWLEWDEELEPSPYRPYVRRPRSVFVEPPIGYTPAPAPAAAPEAATPQHYYSAPGAEDDRARLEADAARRSREILAGAANPAPQFQSDIVAERPQEPGAAQFFRADRPQVRFTRTPEASIARRKAEEEAQRRAVEEEARRIEEEARCKAEESARRLEEARLAQTHAMSNANSEAKPRVRFARTPDRPLPARGAVADPPAPSPANAPNVPPAPSATAAADPATPPAFGAFAAMGARFSFSIAFGGMASPAPTSRRQTTEPPPPAPPAAEAREKPAKMRLRVKAVATPAEPEPAPVVEPAAPQERVIKRVKTPLGGFLERREAPDFPYEPFALEVLPPPTRAEDDEPEDELEVNADALEKTLEDFGVRGDVLNAHPGPVVTLYEFEPAPGIKSSRVIGLADDIARSMSAVSARVAVVPGRNA